MASITHMMPQGLSCIWVLHNRRIEKIEELEPSGHEFLPIDLRDETKEVTSPDD